jgi:hypothetical protein
MQKILVENDQAASPLDEKFRLYIGQWHGKLMAEQRNPTSIAFGSRSQMRYALRRLLT